MDDRPSGGRKAPVDRTRRTGRLVRRPPRPKRMRSIGVTFGHRCWSARYVAPTVPAMRRSLGVAVAALSLVLLVGCSGPGSSSGSSDSSAGGGAAAAPVESAGAPGAPAETDPDRQIVTTATASVSVKDPATGAQRVSELVES